MNGIKTPYTIGQKTCTELSLIGGSRNLELCVAELSLDIKASIKCAPRPATAQSSKETSEYVVLQVARTLRYLSLVIYMNCEMGQHEWEA